MRIESEWVGGSSLGLRAAAVAWARLDWPGTMGDSQDTSLITSCLVLSEVVIQNFCEKLSLKLSLEACSHRSLWVGPTNQSQMCVCVSGLVSNHTPTHTQRDTQTHLA